MNGPRAIGSAMSAQVVVGLMSGTSLDGISAAVSRFTERDGAVIPELLAFVQTEYSAAQRSRLAAALTNATPSEYARLDSELGAWLADAAVAAIAECGVARADIAAIASHGHTVWHEAPLATWQIGNAAVIAERTGMNVISDFRVRDVAAGGQGAPLVPVADALLFAAPTHWRALQNIGGIGNITIVPPNHDLASVRAFDTGPGVCVIDGVVRRLYPEKLYDINGTLALRGTVIDGIVNAMLAERFFSAPPPKSTGRELFTPSYIDAFINSCRAASPSATHEDILATAVELTAASIAMAFAKFIPEPVAEIALSGGGANNPAIVAAIGRALAIVPQGATFAPRRVVRFEELFFSGDAKEAVAFAFLGWLHLQHRPGNVPTATGARGPRILGAFTPK
jgi:anhydro-N-acetylmuramic acid kinase